MKTINIHISDCDSNETYEEIVESVGLSRFDEEGEPKDDAETLTLKGEVTTEKSDGTSRYLTLYKNSGIDETTFNLILKKFNLPKKTNSLTIKIGSVELS